MYTSGCSFPRPCVQPYIGRSNRCYRPPVCPEPVCQVTTGMAEAVTGTSAQIVNNAFTCCPRTVSMAGVEYGTDPTLALSASVQGGIASPFSVTLPNLTPGTTYFYRAFADDAGGRHYGNVMAFATPGLVTVTTGAATNVTSTAATITGSAFSGLAPQDVGLVGIEYSVNPAMMGSAFATTAVANPFTVGLTGLTPATTYYYRAVVVDQDTAFIGSTLSFTTLA